MADTSENDPQTSPYHYPVFLGLGRKPTFMGIPTVWFVTTIMIVGSTAMIFGLWLWLSLFVLLPAMAIITRTDDKAFDIWALELKTRVRNRNKKWWNGSSYSPISYPRRPWQK